MGTFQGDCLEILKGFESNSVDSLVTDPPAGISFMGKAWDDDKGGRGHWIAWMRQVMTECLRVLKPGAHGLVWALPRTSHWTATALEDAGFEVRDTILHLHGQGFPKSLDISKAIDNAAGAEREVVGNAVRVDGRVPALEMSQDMNEAGLTHGGGVDTKNRLITAPATDAAKQWQGWGTCLKPAVEIWWLVRKPISEKTVASNVLKHGTGGINIDASKIESGERRMCGTTAESGKSSIILGARTETRTTTGRFPANLVLSHSEHCEDDRCDMFCPVAMLDEQSGISKSTANQRNNQPSLNLAMSGPNTGHVSFGHADSGGASRFFYCAKSSKSERGQENHHPTVKAQKLMQYLIRMITPLGGTVLDPFMGSGSTGLAAKTLGFSFIGIEKEEEYFEIAQRRIG